MDELGVNAYQLALQSDTPPPSVYDTLNGKNRPTPSTLRKWARVLQIPEQDMLVAAGYLNEPIEDEASQVGREIAIAIRRLPNQKRGEALALTKAIINTLSRI